MTEAGSSTFLFRTVAFEQSDDLGTHAVGYPCVVKRRAAVLVLGIDISTLGEQHFSDHDAAITGCVVKRCPVGSQRTRRLTMRRFELLLRSFVGLALAGSTTWAATLGPTEQYREDLDFAAKLWRALEDGRLVGKKAIYSTPYTAHGGHIVDTIGGLLKVARRTGAVIVQRDYGGIMSEQGVATNPEKYVELVSVMYKRRGYDPKHSDWFWAQYTAAGKLMLTPKGMAFAGRVATRYRCIACHQTAPDGNFVFNYNRISIEENWTDH